MAFRVKSRLELVLCCRVRKRELPPAHDILMLCKLWEYFNSVRVENRSKDWTSLSVLDRITSFSQPNQEKVAPDLFSAFKILKFWSNFTSMLLCIVIDFFLNNQPDALIIQILFCYKTLHVSGIFSVHHQEFSTLHSALVSFIQFSDDRFQAGSGFGSGHQKPARNLPMPNVQ